MIAGAREADGDSAEGFVPLGMAGGAVHKVRPVHLVAVGGRPCLALARRHRVVLVRLPTCVRHFSWFRV